MGLGMHRQDNKSWWWHGAMALVAWRLSADCVDDCDREQATATTNAGILRYAQDDDVKQNAHDVKKNAPNNVKRDASDDVRDAACGALLRWPG
jgi:hypothetical protein